MKRLAQIFVIVFTIVACQSRSQNSIAYKPSLWDFFRPDSIRGPIVSAHRGGPEKGYPENCLETFEHTLSSVCAVIECDVRLTRDRRCVLMHDAALNRTSNGVGLVSEKTLSEIKELFLKDPGGRLTNYRIPTLDEALQWSDKKTVLFTDIKPEVPPDSVMAIIRRNNAADRVVVVTYTAVEAGTYAALDSNLMISCNICQPDDFYRVLNYGVRRDRIVAFTGTSVPDSALIGLLHRNGIACIVGTMGNLDKKALARGDAIYEEILVKGTDVIATDRCKAVGIIIQNFTIATKRKARCVSDVF